MRGNSCDSNTPHNMKKHPNRLLSPSIWFNKSHAAIVAKTPSKEKIMAAGAGEIFFCA